jgi:hypothetical protein
VGRVTVNGHLGPNFGKRRQIWRVFDGYVDESGMTESRVTVR